MAMANLYPVIVHKVNEFVTLNLMTYLSIQYEALKSPVTKATDILNKYLHHGTADISEETARQLFFINEQLELTIRPPNLRRYSTSTLASAIIWHHHGPAAYRSILNDGFLILPSERTLQRTTNSLNLK